MKSNLKLPHTISSFHDLRTQGYYYVDKTDYLEQMESLPQKYIFFLRPRRFGKSLFTSLLRYYYGLEYKAQFPTLFKQLYIGNNPTPLANQYMVLSMEFTKISTTSFEDTFQGFLTRVKRAVDDFFVKYSDYFSSKDREQIQIQKFPADVIELLVSLMKEKAPNQKIYIIIDEYDYFANELIAFDLSNFKKIVSKNGFVRKFYEAIKEGTKESVIDRFFATGITPITLDSLTSGFNIAKDLSTDLRFANMMGFTPLEVKKILHIASEKVPLDLDKVMPELKRWYNGYKFNTAQKETLYNPSMVLYFATHYQGLGEFPVTMLDKNIASDYHKIRLLLTVDNPEQNYEVLNRIIEQDTVTGELTEEFSFEKLFSEGDFLSLLFYNGFLTIEDYWGGDTTFRVPNYVIQRLYLDYFFDLLKERKTIIVNSTKIREAVKEMAIKGNPQLFFDYIQDVLRQLANRDYQNFTEKYVKLLMMSSMKLANAYYIESEQELPDGFLDLSFTKHPAVKVNHEYLFELKYLKKEQAKQLKAKQATAKTQLTKYIAGSDKFNQLKTLQAWTVVAIKDELFVEQIV